MSCVEPFREYLVARFAEDAHVDGTVLFREVVELGFDRSYPTFVRELRLLALRPRCEACRTGGHGVTTVIAHEPGEEIQWDWLRDNPAGIRRTRRLKGDRPLPTASADPPGSSGATGPAGPNSETGPKGETGLSALSTLPVRARVCERLPRRSRGNDQPRGALF